MSALIGRTNRAAADLKEVLSPPRGPGEMGRVDGYRVLYLIGDGGMGVVLEAEDARGQRVAIKVMRPNRRGDDEARLRFRREARIAAGINHPHLLPLLHHGEVRGLPYLVLPLLHGLSLESRLQLEGRLPVVEAIRVARQTAEALAAAHAVGVIHRDVKPANLWLEADTECVKLIDFGLARCADEQAAAPADQLVTQYGATLGTPGYMAPEQIGGGGDLDARADLFSLGCVLYRLVTGKAPFAGRGFGDTLRRTMIEDPPAPSKLNPEVPDDLDALIGRLLAKDRAARPASARAVADELRHLETRPVRRRRGRGRFLFWLLAGLTTLTLAAAAAALWLRG